MKTFNKTHSFGVFLAAISVFFWGITFVCTKSLLYNFSALEILFFRFLCAYFGLWILRPKWEKIALKDNIYFAMAGLTGVVLYQFSENIAIDYTSASNVSVIVAICPMFTAIFSQIFLKEKHISVKFVAGFFIAIFGVLLVSLNGNTTLQLNPKGDFLALAASIFWGFYSIFVSIINRRKYDGICSTRRIFFFAVIFMIPLVIWGLHSKGASTNVDFSLQTNLARFSKPLNWVNLLFLGLIASGFCFAAWSKACEIVGTVKISAGIYMIPVVTIIFAFFALHEPITLMGITGTILTIAGLFLSSWKHSD